MLEGWTKVYTATEEYQAEIIKSLLSNNGLNPIMLDKKDDGFRIGNAEIYTKREEAKKAFEIIKTNDTARITEE